MSRPSLFPLALLAITLFACQPASEEATTEETADTTATTSADAGQIEEAISGLTAQFSAAVAAGDTLALGELYAEDAVIMPPGGERARGRDAVRGVWASTLSTMNGAQLDLRTDAVRVADSGELAYEMGDFTFTWQGPDGAAMQDDGKYVTVWESDGTEWKIAADIWNSNTPPPAP